MVSPVPIGQLNLHITGIITLKLCLCEKIGYPERNRVPVILFVGFLMIFHIEVLECVSRFLQLLHISLVRSLLALH